MENLISLISEIGRASIDNEEDFLSKLLHSSLQIIPEAECGTVYLFKDKKVYFIDG